MERQPHNPYRPEWKTGDESDPNLTVWRFALPLPISTNDLWQPVVKQSKTGRVYPALVQSAKYKDWLKEADGMLLCQPRPRKPLAGALSVSVIVSPQGRDLDNYLKSTMDALEGAGIIRDDMDVSDLVIRRKIGQNPKTISLDISAADILR